MGANVYWAGTTDGTVTDNNGHFTLERPCPMHRYMVISYVGYMNDTVDLDHTGNRPEVVLTETQILQEAVINARGSGTHISKIDPIYKEVITSNELQKAACCNLAESFETNASVDVSYSDAVTGAKQIQLLGLSGTYSQIMTENIPMVKGPATPYGLTYVPGTWMESIQISKGTSSVINGYESITGQINVEYKKPENSDKFFVNMYANDFGRVESSVTSSVKIKDDFYTMVLAHGEFLNKRNDMNKDGFIDHPLITKYNLMNRYRYLKKGVVESMFGFKLMNEDRLAGQTVYKKTNPESTGGVYGVDINTKRYEAFAKNGFFFKRPNTSLGTIVACSYHDQNSKFGNNTYGVVHKNLYTNFIFETQVLSEHHKIDIGPGFTFDDYKESINTLNNKKQEIVPGGFAQYTYNNHNNLTIIGGIRYDNHNLYGSFITPRLHLKYDLNGSITLRASGGKGYRSPNVYAENPFLMMTSRTIIFDEGLRAEEAWNAGGSITYDFELLKREASLSAEYYRTDFVNQTIIDFDRNIKEIHVYNLTGKSFSNSMQLVFNAELIKNLDMMAAYRINDVWTTIDGSLVRKPLVNTYKGLINLSYLTLKNHLQLDFTAQFNGKSRLPNTDNLPEIHRRPGYSPAYTVLNAQITYKSKKFDVYFGGENLTSYMQHHPIISAADPYGDYFDATSIWGPIMPRMFYAGLRFSIN
ncbi:MAG: Ferric enterobactin receptor precursor [Bacteroidetes bacterium ADurb.Bin408]|nr:MAG: Ferric enterobactin receptor precursor [Bacteroidetes bacterium ADurb.Bin408]